MKITITDSIAVKRIKAVTLFKLFFLGLAVWLVPISIIAGILALFGMNSYASDGVNYYGVEGLFRSISAGLALPAVFALTMTCVTWPGLWLYSKFRNIKIDFIKEKSNQTVEPACETRVAQG
ncbi:MAG: hypothetical protein ACFCUX_07670 [Candidatus Methylacidiphilales bacterium]